MDTANQAANTASRPNGASASGAAGAKIGIARDNAARTDSRAASAPAADGGPATGLTEKIRHDAAILRNALAFTQVIGVLMRSPHYQRYALADLEWLVIPPLIAGQFRIGEAKPDNGQGPTLPVAVVLWASVSADVDRRLTEGDGAALRLKPEEWKSGDIPWLLHAAGETRFVRFVVDQLMKTTFKGRAVKVRGRDQDGNLKVHMLEGA